MNIEEIFTKLLEHMMLGVKFHEQAMLYFEFLTLPGYKKCQEYHYYEELINYRKLYDYYLDVYKKLLKIAPQQYDLINMNMYKYSRDVIDTNTKRNVIREIMKKWIAWETETKELLENCYKEVSSAAASVKILELLKEVEQELCNATNKYIQLETVDYDIIMIEEEQMSLQKEYKHKIAHLKM